MPRPIHFEIHADDPQRATEFYTKVFGWTFTFWGGPMEYWIVSTGDKSKPGIDGGLLRRRGPAPVEGQVINAFPCTLDVPDVDDYAAKIERQGGRVVVPKMPIPGVGWLAYAKDTEGNIFGIMQDDPGAGG